MTGFIDPLELNGAEAEEAVTADNDAGGQDTLDQVRELVLRAHPEVVPELVRGSSFSELLASVEPAHQAYVELAARLTVDTPAQPTHRVPAGGTGPAPMDLDRIPTAEKLRRGDSGPDQPATSLIGIANRLFPINHRGDLPMAMTQVEAAKLSNDMLIRGVIETIVKDSAILKFLPFMEVTGTSVRYTREATMPAATFHAVGDTWVEATPTFTNHTANLAILGGDADVDNYLQATYADANDIEAEVIANRAKAIAHKFSESFITGNTGVDADSFNGIRTLAPAGQTLATGVNGAAIDLQKLDELIDLIKPGKPEALLLSRRTRRQLKHLRRTTGPILESTVSQFGEQVETYEGIPIVVDDFMPDNEVQGTSGAVCSSVYALKFGMSSGLMGLQHGGITVETVGELETKDATRHRLKWYTGLALMSELGVARLQGITA